ncbi:MAG: hypothetical protein CL723_05050 [Chloroflexi bacterium]|jgi:uncharacterized membrane protein YvbJ|nr:hypothetical protein [Chloroflexota bacterium]|tara:strand:- start:1897 stop:2091 length:195 start_codon:yes stop_codon:yes gene_type:complete
MTNFCDKCGNEVKANVRFCDNCWNTLNDTKSKNDKRVKKIVQAEDVARHQYYGRQSIKKPNDNK